MKKPTTFNPQRANHLATRLERISTAKYALPSDLMRQYHRLQQLTSLVHMALAEMFDETLLTTCQVVYYDGTTLTIATNQHTAIGHLGYLSTAIIEQLVSYDPCFAHLQQLQITPIYHNTQSS